jgi:hypothetical protein
MERRPLFWEAPWLNGTNRGQCSPLFCGLKKMEHACELGCTLEFRSKLVKLSYGKLVSTIFILEPHHKCAMHAKHSLVQQLVPLAIRYGKFAPLPPPNKVRSFAWLAIPKKMNGWARTKERLAKLLSFPLYKRVRGVHSAPFCSL